MLRFTFLTIFIALIFSSCKKDDYLSTKLDSTATTALVENTKNTKPNIIVFLADDLGWDDIQMNNPVMPQTPNIEKLAREGVLFNNGYVTGSICSPTRAGFLTGIYQSKFGIYQGITLVNGKHQRVGIPAGMPTIGNVLQQGGYTTGVVGKWHVGSFEEHKPKNKGFDYSFSTIYGVNPFILTTNPEAVSIGNVTNRQYHHKFTENDTIVEIDSLYVTDVLREKSLSFIRKNQNNPFFLYHSFGVPHAPLQSVKKYYDQVTNYSNEKNRIFKAMILAMDDVVGDITNELEELGIADNTMIIFLSDNGGENNPESRPIADRLLNGYKTDLHDGGIRSPFIVRWPNYLPANTKCNSLVSSLDILPTCASLAGVDLGMTNGYDGENFINYIENDNYNKEKALYWARNHDLGKLAMRRGKYKIFLTSIDAVPELFDMEKDPYEQNNIYSSSPEIGNSMKKDLMLWSSQNIPQVVAF